MDYHDIGHARNLQGVMVNACHLYRFPDDRVFEAVQVLDSLHLGVLDDKIFDECLVDSDIDVLVDGGGDEETLMVGVIRGQVGATAAERNSERAANDDHGPSLP